MKSNVATFEAILIKFLMVKSAIGQLASSNVSNNSYAAGL